MNSIGLMIIMIETERITLSQNFTLLMLHKTNFQFNRKMARVQISANQRSTNLTSFSVSSN